MDRKQLFAFIKNQLPMVPHIHAALDDVEEYIGQLEGKLARYAATAAAEVPPKE
jgi:hypothetical protein